MENELIDKILSTTDKQFSNLEYYDTKNFRYLYSHLTPQKQ